MANIRLAVAEVLMNEPFTSADDAQIRVRTQEAFSRLQQDADMDVLQASGGDLKNCVRKYKLSKEQEESSRKPSSASTPRTGGFRGMSGELSEETQPTNTQDNSPYVESALTCFFFYR